MDNVITLNFLINGLEITELGGTSLKGKTDRRFTDDLTQSVNLFEFKDTFRKVIVQPDKTVGMTFGVSANNDNCFLVGPSGREFDCAQNTISFVSSESVLVTVLVIFV